MRLVTTSQSCSERGLGLVEAVVSSGLVIVLALGLTQLVAMSTASVSTVARETTALLAAVQKMEQLQGFSWGSPALRLSPVDSLTRDTAGYVDFLDRHGVSVGSGINPPTGASLVRRWSVRPRGSSVRNDGGLVLSVVVALMQRVERSPLPPLGSVEAGRRLVVHAQNVAGDASGGTMSLTEIVLALMLTSVVVGTTLQLVDPVRDVLGVQTHTSELHQRVRTGFERFHRDLVNAGLAVSNPGAGHYPLVAVVPGRIGGRPLNGRGNASSADDALTLLSTDVGAADVSTVSSLQNANTSVQITCVMSAAACGLRPDTTILIADTLGRSGLLRVTRVTGSVLTVVPLAGRQFSYGPGASIRPVSVRSYYHDEGRIQVRVEDGWRTDSPFLDGVVGLSFRYFGAPNSLAAGAGCAGGPFLSNTTMTSRQVELRPEALNDGPWCDGPIPYDVDVLRVQRIRVEIRFQTSDPAYRGTDPRLFARAGTAVRGRRAVPDATGSFDVTLRNKWWGSAQ